MPSAVGTKRPRPTATATGVEPPPVVPIHQQQQNPKPAAARQLSGATKNMRFMKRRGGDLHSRPQGQSDEASQPKKNVPKARDDTTTAVVMGLSSNSTTATGLLHGGEVQQSAHHAATTDSVESSDEEMADSNNCASPGAALQAVPVQTATPQDMYGWEQSQALGRRSFGGFQPVTTENWYHQQQAHKAASGVMQHQLSDSELRRLHSRSTRRGKKQSPHDQQQPNKRDNKKLKQISGSGGKSTKNAVERGKLMDELMME